MAAEQKLFIQNSTVDGMKRLLLAFLNEYKKGIASGDFYEEPIGDDFVYPDW